MADGTIRVEIAYATPERQSCIELGLNTETSAMHAIVTSGILQQFPEIDLEQQAIGVSGTICKPDKILADGDRVEIYRPLRQNPMDARRGRLKK